MLLRNIATVGLGVYDPDLKAEHGQSDGSMEIRLEFHLEQQHRFTLQQAITKSVSGARNDPVTCAYDVSSNDDCLNARDDVSNHPRSNEQE